VPEGVFERRLLRPTAQPTELGEGGESSTSKLAVPVVYHLQNPPKTVCSIGGPAYPLAPQPVSQSGLDAWISEIWDYLKDNILPEDHVFAERIVQLAKRHTVVEGDLYRCGANDILMRCITQEEGHELLLRSMDVSAEVILHPAHWSVRPSGMASTGQPPSMMQLRW
jgi:hypothetical protein